MDPLIRQSKYALSLKSLKMWIFAKQFFKLGKAIEDKEEFLQKTITTTNKQKLGRILGPIPDGGKSETWISHQSINRESIDAVSIFYHIIS